MVMQLMTYDDRDKKGNKDMKEGREGGREGASFMIVSLGRICVD